jgi:hypothetical protein
LAAYSSRYLVNIFFVLGLILALVSAFKPEWEYAAILGSSSLLIVGAISHYAHVRGWEEDASRYQSMSAPFYWCQEIWNLSDENKRQTLIQELGVECVAEISNWLLSHRNRAINLLKG